jgi:hypothetical protein
MRELIENSIISCYLKIADAIAEGSSSGAKMNRAFKSIMKKGKKAVASARTSRDADRIKDKVADKLAPVVARGAAKQQDSEGRASSKMQALKMADDEGQDLNKIAAEIPSGKNDSTQRAGRQLNMTRKGQAGARISGRVINRAQNEPTNIHREVAMDKEHSTEKKRRNRAATERFERIKRKARWN